MLYDENAIDEFFPKPSYRPNQREVILESVRWINSGKRFIIAECPTGAGKSAIAATLAGLSGNAYYITTTKMLQDQIELDFKESGDVETLKGRNAYPCTAYTQFNERLVPLLGKPVLDSIIAEKPSCSEGYCKSYKHRSSCSMCLPNKEDLKKAVFPDGNKYSFCEYFERYFKTLNAPIASMNFNNFILHLNYGNKFKPRKLLVIDEAHNTEAKLLDFLETTINSRHLDLEIPDFENAIDYVKWLLEVNAINILKTKAEQAMENMDTRSFDMYDGLLKKYSNMILQLREDPSGWVAEFEKTEVSTMSKLKPIFASKAAHEYLFKQADVIVFLSATILNANVFAKSLGINMKEAAAIRIKSTFPVENRPIITDFAGTFTGGKAKMDKWIGSMAKKVQEISERYADKKGIIHTHSFGIQKALIQNLPSHIKKRLIQQHEFVDKTEMLRAHAERPNSIIIAPAMHEGVDLKDDLSRFQILCKIPYANFYENKQMRKRMDLDMDYYDHLTIMKIVQSVGRSVRSAEDWAHTYIIDKSFERIFRLKRSFPDWFKESVTNKIPEYQCSK